MNGSKKKEIVATLDLGTNKVVVLIAEIGEEGVSVLGIGRAETDGLRRGVVISIGKTVDAIVKAKHDAEQMSGYLVREVIAGVGGTHIVGVNNHGMVTTKMGEIRGKDVERVLEAASMIPMQMDRSIVNCLPVQYLVDEHEGIRDPIGMSGVRLEAYTHLITGARTAIENVLKCAERSGLSVVEFVANPLASALAVLEPNEMEIGVCCLDLGAGTADLTIWTQGSLLHTCVLGAGGQVITSDISTGLRTPLACAEELKVQQGVALGRLVPDDDTIEVPAVGGRPNKRLSRHALTEIIEPRVAEIFELVRREILKTGYADLLAGGVVITGGSAQMPGMADLGDVVLNLPVRIGLPRNVKGLPSLLQDPALSTAYGLAVYSALPYDSAIPNSMLPVRRLNKPKGIMQFLRRVASFLF
jgi:cell division protein FtsA